MGVVQCIECFKSPGDSDQQDYTEYGTGDQGASADIEEAEQLPHYVQEVGRRESTATDLLLAAQAMCLSTAWTRVLPRRLIPKAPARDKNALNISTKVYYHIETGLVTSR